MSGVSLGHPGRSAMRKRLKAWFTVELVLGFASLGLAVLTAINGEWIEAFTGLEPDAGDGTLEWAIVIALAIAATVLGRLALRDGRRLAATRA
jgi:hypothetical protein